MKNLYQNQTPKNAWSFPIEAFSFAAPFQTLGQKNIPAKAGIL